MEEEKIKTILQASYKPQRDAEADLAKLNYSYDPELSTMENKVFVDKATGQPNIAYRGSVTAKDWLGNLKQIAGLRDTEAEKRVALAGKVREKYGVAPDTYGHSRGGRLSELAGEQYGGRSYTYNKATLPKDIFKTIRPEQTDIRTDKDIVSKLSILQRGGKKTTKKTGIFTSEIASHGLSAMSPSYF